MTEQQKRVLMKQVGVWARRKGIPRPSTRDQWKGLISQYIAERVKDGLSNQYWDEIPDADPTHLVDDGSTIQIADAAPTTADDWEQMLRDRAEASVGPNGEILDDFDRDVRLMGMQQDALTAQAPFTRTNPTSVVGAVLGGFATFQQLSGSQKVSLARWNGADEDVRSVTCTFTEMITGAFAKFRPYGIVSYSIRDSTTTIEVDINQGCQFTIGASQVLLEMAIPIDIAPLTGFDKDAKFYAGAISFDQVFRTTPITRTIYSENLADGQIYTGRFPKFTRRIVVERYPFSAPFTLFLNGGDDSGESEDIAEIKVGANARMDPLTIPGDAYGFDIRNTTGGGNAIDFIRVICELSL